MEMSGRLAERPQHGGEHAGITALTDALPKLCTRKRRNHMFTTHQIVLSAINVSRLLTRSVRIFPPAGYTSCCCRDRRPTLLCLFFLIFRRNASVARRQQDFAVSICCSCKQRDIGEESSLGKTCGFASMAESRMELCFVLHRRYLAVCRRAS
jgi:hypothetical protein